MMDNHHALAATGAASNPPSLYFEPGPTRVFGRWHALGVLARRWYILVGVLLLGALVTLILAKRVHPQYFAESTVLMVAQPTSGNGQVAADAPARPVAAVDLPSMVKSPSVLSRIAADLHTKNAAALGAHIRARMGSENSSIMPIQFTARTPAEAIEGANAAAVELAAYYRTVSTSRFDLLIDDLEHQVAQRRQQLNQIDSALQRQKSRDPFVNAKDGAQSLSDQLLKLVGLRDDAAAALRADRANASITAQRSSEVRDAARRELASSDNTYLQLQQQYARDNASLQHALASYGPEYPGLPELRGIVAREKAGLAEHERRIQSMPVNASPQYAAALGEVNRANAVAAADQARVAELDREIAAMRARVSGAAPTAVAVASLSRDRDSAEAAYNVVSSRLASAYTQRAESASVGSVVVMDRARSASASMTSGIVIMAANAVIFVWLAIAATFLVDAWDSRLRDRNVVESVYHAPVLVTVGRGIV